MLGCGAAAASQDSSSPLKVFLAAPSVQSFLTVGDMVESAMTEAQGRQEEESGKPNRPPNKEFEAVKKHLADGIVVRGPVSSKPSWVPGTEPAPLSKALKRVQLPSVQPSFLAGDEPFVVPLRPFTLADQFVELADALSAYHRTALRMRVLAPAKMGRDGVVGVWDVGSVGITFARPARLQALTIDGAPTGADVVSMRADFTTHCGERGLSVNAKGINARWRDAAIAWIGRAPTGTASVGTRQINGKDQYEKLVIDTMDVDRDGIQDFSVWSGMEEAVASTDTFWKAIFGNVKGAWVWLAFAQEADCT